MARNPAERERERDREPECNYLKADLLESRGSVTISLIQEPLKPHAPRSPGRDTEASRHAGLG